MTTRWIKVWRDLWSNRSRTILVVLSIAVGVFAIGMITSTQQALNQSLSEQYAALRQRTSAAPVSTFVDLVDTRNLLTRIDRLAGGDCPQGGGL